MNFSFLSATRRSSANPVAAPSLLHTDVNAHILPGQHDGVDSLDQSVRLLRSLAACGVRKVVGTLHIMSEYYLNTAESITETVRLVKTQLQTDRIPIQLIPAAEYYIDRGLLRLLYHRSPLLTFGDEADQQYLLFDTNLVAAPAELENVLMAFRQRKIIPIMAHPEQYIYLQKDPDYLFRLQEMGVLFQVNLLSLVGKPTQACRNLAEWMIDQELASFLGSNLMHDYQVPLLQYAMTLPHYRKAVEMGLKNEMI